MTEPNLLNEIILMERLPGLREVHLFDELDSTSDFGKELASGEHQFPAIIYARKQTRGRGRGGKSWVSDQGSLTFSIVLDVESSQTGSQNGPSNLTVARFSIDWGLAVASALNELGGQNDKFFVKWPNDVYAWNKKVSGILIESVANFPFRRVIGIGINVSNSSQRIKQQDSSVAEAISIEEATRKRFSHLEILESIWRKFHCVQVLDVAAWRSQFDQVDFLKDKFVSIEQGQRVLSGKYMGTGRHGQLLLQVGEEILDVHSGSVSEITN